MAQSFDWNDAEEIGIALAEQYPGQNPLELRFTDLHQRVMTLEGFAGEAEASSEGKLEAIQMAWYEEWQENQ
jgi:FeS assembly protein IscX